MVYGQVARQVVVTHQIAGSNPARPAVSVQDTGDPPKVAIRVRLPVRLHPLRLMGGPLPYKQQTVVRFRQGVLGTLHASKRIPYLEDWHTPNELSPGSLAWAFGVHSTI